MVKTPRKQRSGYRARRFMTQDEQETMSVAARLARSVRAGDIICLNGPLGSGKTTFVKGFARGAGFKGAVMSPTFGLVRLYRAPRLNLHHLDLFRVRPEEIVNLGLEEYWNDPRGVCLIEWPEAARMILPADRLEMALSHRAKGGRSFVVRASGSRSRRLMSGLGV